MTKETNEEVLRGLLFDLVKFMNEGAPGHRQGIHKNLMLTLEEILDEAEDEYFNRT